MGYTHYWSGVVRLDEDTLNNVRKIIVSGGLQGISIKGWDGTGEPEVSESAIRLNGDSDKDEDYETFTITPENGSDFCKTAREPYDAVVGSILIYLKEQNPEDFSVRSDGDFEDDEDWGAAKALYEKTFGTTPSNPL